MNLDERLSQPIAEIPDENFSAHVMAELARHEIRKARIETGVWTALAVIAVGLLAISQPGREIAAAALSLNFFAQACIGLVILLLLFPPRIATD